MSKVTQLAVGAVLAAGLLTPIEALAQLPFGIGRQLVRGTRYQPQRQTQQRRNTTPLTASGLRFGGKNSDVAVSIGPGGVGVGVGTDDTAVAVAVSGGSVGVGVAHESGTAVSVGVGGDGVAVGVNKGQPQPQNRLLGSQQTTTGQTAFRQSTSPLSTGVTRQGVANPGRFRLNSTPPATRSGLTGKSGYWRFNR